MSNCKEIKQLSADIFQEKIQISPITHKPGHCATPEIIYFNIHNKTQEEEDDLALSFSSRNNYYLQDTFALYLNLSRPDFCNDKIIIHSCNISNRNTLRTFSFARISVRTASETHFIHLCNH